MGIKVNENRFLSWLDIETNYRIKSYFEKSNSMDWKQSLDRYLTNPPDDGFDGWASTVIEAFSNEFYESNEDWINETGGLCDKWLNKLFNQGIPPEIAAKVIERTYNITHSK